MSQHISIEIQLLLLEGISEQFSEISELYYSCVRHNGLMMFYVVDHFSNCILSKFQPKEYMEVAERAASFIRRHLYDEQTHRLQHSFRNGPSKAPGFLDDYAFLISGLLDLYEFGSGTKWLVWAIELQNTQVRVSFVFLSL